MVASPTPNTAQKCGGRFLCTVEGALTKSHHGPGWHSCSVSYKTQIFSSPQSSAAVGALSSQAILLAQRSSAALLTKAVDAGSWPLHSALAAGRTVGLCPRQRQMTYVNETVKRQGHRDGAVPSESERDATAVCTPLPIKLSSKPSSQQQNTRVNHALTRSTKQLPQASWVDSAR